MIEAIKEIKSGPKELRSFGLTVGIFFGILGVLFLWRGQTANFFFFLAAFFSIFGLFWPTPLKPIQKIWMALALMIGWVMTRLILCILFYALITPIRFLSRLFGKRFLSRILKNSHETYWVKRKGRFDRDHFEVQF